MSSAVVNVLRGWLGLPLPTTPRQRSRSRAGYRKTSRRQSTPLLIRRLEAARCQPHQAGPGQWFAWCPTCLGSGRYQPMEIRRAEDGTLLLACCQAHEPPRSGRAA